MTTKSGTVWTTADVSCLHGLVIEGFDVVFIAERLQRSELAIECKVADLVRRSKHCSHRISIPEYHSWLTVNGLKHRLSGNRLSEYYKHCQEIADTAAEKRERIKEMYGGLVLQSNTVVSTNPCSEISIDSNTGYIATQLEPLTAAEINETIKTYIEGDISMTNQVNTEANITPAVKIKHITTVNGHDITKLSDQDLINQVVKCEEQIDTLTELNLKLKISQIADTIVDLDQTKTLLTVELAERAELAKSSD